MNVSTIIRGMAGAGVHAPNRSAVPWRRVDGRILRFTRDLDDESEYFEKELHTQSIVPCREGIDRDGTLTSERGVLELPLQQRHVWLRQARSELRLLQVRDHRGRAAMQAVVSVYRPRHLPWLGHGVAHRLGHATSAAEEQWGLSMLRMLCAADGDFVTLRLQPKRLGVHALCDIESRARRAGFSLTDPEGVTRTLLVDLRPSSEHLLATLSAKTRKKLRSFEGSEFVMRPLLDATHAGQCRAASLASVRRHGKSATRAPIEAILALAPLEPTRVRAIGIFRVDRPSELLAFAAAQRDGEIAEYRSAGSIDDPHLRKHPFNYWLLWELTEWARANGAHHFDLGGISDGGPDDPLAGIASFKRHFTHTEAEVGRELLAVLRPSTWLASSAWRQILRGVPTR